MNAQDFERFEKLERANAQIDVWIDEEKYEKVMSCYKVNSNIEGSVELAFKEENNCTKGKDDEWANILNTKEIFPIISITVIDNDGKEDNIQLKNSALNNSDSPDSYWSRFFWAKFIRAKIQEKGTNCCFRRLDQILTYLERNLPIVSQKDNDQNNKLLYKQLTVIYLLEMAAAGEGVDQRSFAMRARRLLADSEFKKDFKDFYDLLARYNIGIGYFHEASYREAIRQFNYIIYNWEKWELEKENNFKLFADSRKGKEFINIPSAIYRADIQLKLQLAYHAYRTTINKLDNNLSEYKKSKKHLIVAEVYQQLEQLDEFKKALAEVCPSAAPEIENDDLKKVVKLTRKECQDANIRGKLQSLYADWYLQNLKRYLKKRKHYDSQNKLKETEIKDYLSGLNEFYRDYKIFSKYTEFDRSGYLEQIAEYLVWLTENGTSRTELKDILKEETKKIYIGDGSSNGNNDDNRSDLLIEEENEDGQEGDTPCPCEKKGIDLRQIREEHYNEFRENILTFFRKSEKLFDDASDKNFLDTLKEDKKKFLNRLLKVEKNRSNLEHRKRQFRMEGLDVTPPMWGGNNCMPSKCDYCKTDKGGTHCFFEHSKSNPSNNHRYESLTVEDYEHIMDHWDDKHFLKYLKNPSHHQSSKQAIHFIGLQRWNSSSPAQGRSLGGGYLIYHNDDKGCVDLGIAIDPGFDFIRNLFHAGFSLADIDVVLISHAHLDHVRDFESIITLLLELQSRVKKRNGENNQRKIHVILTLGGYRRLEYIFESFTLHRFVEPYIIDVEKEIDDNFLESLKTKPFKFIRGVPIEEPKEEGNWKNPRLRFEPDLGISETDSNNQLRLTITPTKSYHDDYTEYSDSFGFLIKISDKNLVHTLGYTGDTSWDSDVMKQYKDCDTLLVHLGSIIDRKDKEKRRFSYYENSEICFDLIRGKNHPYLMGMLHFLTEIYGNAEPKTKPLILLSEFGEELRGRLRLDLVDKLKHVYNNKRILPVDVGLDVILAKKATENDKNGDAKQKECPNVLCVQCEEFVRPEDADFAYYGYDEALFCVCRTCLKSTSPDILQTRLRLLYEEGRPLQTY